MANRKKKSLDNLLNSVNSGIPKKKETKVPVVEKAEVAVKETEIVVETVSEVLETKEVEELTNSSNTSTQVEEGRGAEVSEIKVVEKEEEAEKPKPPKRPRKSKTPKKATNLEGERTSINIPKSLRGQLSYLRLVKQKNMTELISDMVETYCKSKGIKIPEEIG